LIVLCGKIGKVPEPYWEKEGRGEGERCKFA